MADDTEHCDFVQKLIDAVRERKCLYDKKHIAYFNRREREKAWRQIAAQLGRSDVDCHKRWKLLREKLAKELKKRDKALENGETFQSDWACFESIMFVEDHISPRKKLEKQPLMLVKDLSKKRRIAEDNNSKIGTIAEKRPNAYNANDFSFFMQLSKSHHADSPTVQQQQQQQQLLSNVVSPSCSVVKTEPIDKQSDDQFSLTANEQPLETASNETTTSSFNEAALTPGTLDLTKAVDVLLKDLRDKKETSLNFMKNLTAALKIKDLDVFKCGAQNETQLKTNINLNEDSKAEDTDYDDESLAYSKNAQNSEDTSTEGRNSRAYNNVSNFEENDFSKQNSLSPTPKSVNCGLSASELKVEQVVKMQNVAEVQNRVAEKDELFGKLVTSMLTDITDEEYKDDAKFSMMQLLVNAKRACKAKKSDSSFQT